MRVGTKSVLFGAHAFWLHPWFVAAAWWKLYGFPKEPWLWIAFFVHDLGYWGKPNMDGPEGESHPLLGAEILYKLEIWLHKRGWKKRVTGKWGNEVLFHSRFWAQKSGRVPSNLCWADKLSLALMPRWLYFIMVRTTGEIHEYRWRQHTGQRDTLGMVSNLTYTDWQWVTDMQKFSREVARKRVHAP